MKYTVKYRNFFPKVERLSIETADRNEAISEMRDLIFFGSAVKSWIEADGKVIDYFVATSEVVEAIKAAEQA